MPENLTDRDEALDLRTTEQIADDEGTSFAAAYATVTGLAARPAVSL